MVFRSIPGSGWTSRRLDLHPAQPCATVVFGTANDEKLKNLVGIAATELDVDYIVDDRTVSMRADMMEETWRIVQPVLDAWAADRARQLPAYLVGSSGPNEADSLFAKR